MRHADAMIATLAAAFANDPGFSWVIPDAADRHARLPRIFAPIIAADMKRGHAIASAAHEVVTLWRAPGAADAGLLETLGLLPAFARALGPNLWRGLAVSSAIEAHHPKTRFAYLHYAGVQPAHQGKGWGGRAIREGLARASQAGVPAYLETATPENVGLYQSLGFSVTAEWDVPRGGPHFWSMMAPA
jgi:ribosomal protein S18 acetylase RimI-like enzyme